MIRRSFLANFCRSPRKKNKKPDRRLPVHFVYFISRNFQQICSSRWTKMRLFPPFFRCFFPKAEAKSSLHLQSRKERCIFIGHYGGVIIHVKSVTERIHKILLRNFLPYLLHNSLQVKKFALLVCRSVYSAWCSRPSSLVDLGFQPVFEQFGSWKVKCASVTLHFLPPILAYFLSRTSKPRFSVFVVVYYISLSTIWKKYINNS